jgi:thiosulfate/3-mercaptopyruvate sulfurtransferase
MSWLINAAQFDKFRKNQKNLIILDASFHHGDRKGQDEFLAKHIIGAQFFDVDLFSDPTSDIPHMLVQDEKRLGELMGQIGIRNDYKIILYDNSDLHSACRAHWIFKMIGHNSHLLYILDGGMRAWENYGGKTESGKTNVGPKSYKAELKKESLRTLSQMKQNLHDPKEQIIDTRLPVRFAGGPETRPGLRRGHIPGSFCLPYPTFFDKEGNFLPLEKIRKKIVALGVDFTQPIVASCGSGMSAAVLDFSLDLLAHPTHGLYDGSWSEWGKDSLFPGEKSLAERPVETCID